MSDVNGRKRTRRTRKEQAIQSRSRMKHKTFFSSKRQENRRKNVAFASLQHRADWIFQLCFISSQSLWLTTTALLGLPRLVNRSVVFAHAFMFTREMEHSLIQVFLSQRALKLKDVSFASSRTKPNRAEPSQACFRVPIRAYQNWLSKKERKKEKK